MAKAPPTLIGHAVAAVQEVHALTVGLASAGANSDVLKQLGQCGEVLAQVVKALGSGPSLDNAGPQGQPSGPPQSAPAGPPAGPAAGSPQPAPQPVAAHHAMAAASSALQAAAAASAQKPQ